ncbi:MAG: alanine--tRNA ligase [Chloroflexota bacterium]
MTSKEVRQLYLDYFKKQGHTVLPSSSLVPHGDPTLLLTTAGMVQIKPFFLGQQKPPSPRLVSCQKCFRTTDVESVGDATHLTFFEMLGNFSVGDYFKKEAIAWAWEFCTDYLKLEPERIWATVYLDDDEAFAFWEQTGIPASKILRFGDEDNFWGPAGNSGPCGPCSELHYDRGADKGCSKPTCGPNCDCGRFVEIWNLVFTQYDQKPDGSRTLLPKPNIDTGMGLERVVAAVQGKDSAYETDLFDSYIRLISSMTGHAYGESPETDRAMRIVAEHGRGMTFLVADGVLPTNEGRGYILRRILRRASLFGRRIGLKRPFLTEIAREVNRTMGDIYPEIVEHSDLVMEVINAEEQRFMSTLETGMGIVDDLVRDASAKGRDTLSGADVFRLYDTYGFPRELTAEVAAERGLGVDVEGFEAALEQQRERARAAHTFHGGEDTGGFAGVEPTEFQGYEDLRTESTVVGLRADGQDLMVAKSGTDVEIVLDRSPFYGEMGGQVGDLGRISSDVAEIEIHGTVRTPADVIVHLGHVGRGRVSVGDRVVAQVEEGRRLDIARNHTSTHLLQAALRSVLGPRVMQRGSLVEPGRLRFDFSWMGSIEREKLVQVEQWINEKIRADLPVLSGVKTYQEAIDEGAIALFDEKYGDEVRTISVGEPPISTELCGGTHVRSTGQIGLFLISSEGSVGTGLRRIEAVTGRGAEQVAHERGQVLESIAGQLETTGPEVMERLQSVLQELDLTRRRVSSLERQLSSLRVESLLQSVREVSGVRVVAARVDGLSLASLREMGDSLRERLGDSVVVFASLEKGKPTFLVMVSEGLTSRGVHAGTIARRAAQIAGGGGGGKPTMAQAGGKDAAKVDESLAEAVAAVEEQLGQNAG